MGFRNRETRFGGKGQSDTRPPADTPNKSQIHALPGVALHKRRKGHFFHPAARTIARIKTIYATVGGGYARLKYDKYECRKCGRHIGNYTENYFGPAKIGVTFSYVIR
ncbi:MAG: DUF3575 domain-containing protein [Rikenellaceae bacterium]|nr:DUF3575 domain-containing protein [Rikenellaceae bacterium]